MAFHRLRSPSAVACLVAWAAAGTIALLIAADAHVADFRCSSVEYTTADRAAVACLTVSLVAALAAIGLALVRSTRERWLAAVAALPAPPVAAVLVFAFLFRCFVF